MNSRKVLTGILIGLLGILVIVLIVGFSMRGRQAIALPNTPTIAPPPPATVEPIPEPTATQVPLLLGERKNPAKIGDTVVVDTRTSTISVTLISVVRGEQALLIAKNANQFNKVNEGKEIIMATFKIKNLKDLSGKDESYLVSNIRFDYADSTYATRYSCASVAGLNNGLNMKLYEGSETEGVVCFKANQGDVPAYAVFEDVAWFDMTAHAQTPQKPQNVQNVASGSNANLGVTREELLLKVNGMLKLNNYLTLGEPYKNKGGGLSCFRSDGSVYTMKIDNNGYVTEAAFFTGIETKVDCELTIEDYKCILILLCAVFDESVYSENYIDPELSRLMDSMFSNSGSNEDIVLAFEDKAIVGNVICEYNHLSSMGQSITIKLKEP